MLETVIHRDVQNFFISEYIIILTFSFVTMRGISLIGECVRHGSYLMNSARWFHMNKDFMLHKKLRLGSVARAFLSKREEMILRGINLQ